MVLLLSIFMGAVIGSLLDTVFGVHFLNYELLPENGLEIHNFYIIKEMKIQLTPSSLIGAGVAIYILLKKG